MRRITPTSWPITRPTARRTAWFIAVIGILLVAAPAHARDDEIVHFPSLAPDHVQLDAHYLRPDGPGPFPAIVMVHGCAGMLRADGQDLSALYRAWLTHFRDAGYAALLIDSFTPRNVHEICTIALKDRAVSPGKHRVGDAYAGLDWLAARPEIAPTRIGFIGWSNGGATVLAGVNRPAPDATARFAAAIAFYPGCETYQHRDWTSAIPLAILMGTDDDWTRPGPCQDLTARAKAAGVPVDITLYPDAYHSFDGPNTPVHTREVWSGTVHLGTNPAARAAAFTDVDAFWAKTLRATP